MLVKSALLAILATMVGGLFAWWSAPFIVARINPADNPARLVLPADWRVLGFAAALSVAVTFLFGLLPALRASSVKPSSALKGGDNPHSRRRLMHALIAAQVAFCFLVHFGAGLSVSTLKKLSQQPTGFLSERLLTLETVAQRPQPTEFWYQTADHLRTIPGVDRVAVAGWPLLSGNGANGFVAVNGQPPGDVLHYFLNVSPGWLDTMKIRLLDGRDFRPDDTVPGTRNATAGVAIVNRAFAKLNFNGENPVGKSFDRGKQHYKIIGLARDARYRNMREPITPTAYVPLRYTAPEALGSATFLVRTTNPNPLSIAGIVRREIARTRPEFRVSNIRTQTEINEAQTIRERLLAMLALFFAAWDCCWRESDCMECWTIQYSSSAASSAFGLPVGAPARNIARLVTLDVFSMVLLGSAAGAGAGLLLKPYIKSLLYQIASSDVSVFALPALTILSAVLLAALPAVIRAIRTDAVAMLRAEYIFLIDSL